MGGCNPGQGLLTLIWTCYYYLDLLLHLSYFYPFHICYHAWTLTTTIPYAYHFPSSILPSRPPESYTQLISVGLYHEQCNLSPRTDLQMSRLASRPSTLVTAFSVKEYPIFGRFYMQFKLLVSRRPQILTTGHLAHVTVNSWEHWLLAQICACHRRGAHKSSW